MLAPYGVDKRRRRSLGMGYEDAAANEGNETRRKSLSKPLTRLETAAFVEQCLKRRWLVLWESCHLAYYENERMRKLIKEINLNDCEEIRANFRRKPNEPVIRVDEFAFSVPIRGDGSREFVFIPENQDAMQRWCDKLESMRRGKSGETGGKNLFRVLRGNRRFSTPEIDVVEVSRVVAWHDACFLAAPYARVSFFFAVDVRPAPQCFELTVFFPRVLYELMS